MFPTPLLVEVTPGVVQNGSIGLDTCISVGSSAWRSGVHKLWTPARLGRLTAIANAPHPSGMESLNCWDRKRGERCGLVG